MAQRSRNGPATISRLRAYAPAEEARDRFATLWSRESILRLLLSLVLAIALWLYVTDRQNPVIFTFSQPLTISPSNLRLSLTVANNLPSVHATIRILNRGQHVSTANFHTFVNLDGLGPGLYHDVPVRVLADPGIQVISVQPSHVAVLIEHRLTKQVPVRYHILNHPGRGYSAGNISVNPSTLSVSGPRSLVSVVAQAVVYVDLSQARSSLGGSYPVTLKNSQGATIMDVSRLNIAPQQILVHVAIQSVASYKTLPVLATLHGHPPSGLGVVSVEVQPSNITATGAPQALGAIATAKTAPISLSRGRGRVFTIYEPIQLPNGVTSHTKKVKVTVTVAPISAGSSIEIAVAPSNVGQGLVVHARPSSVLVTVVGSSHAVENAAKTVRATINLAGKGPGTYSLSPIVHAPGLRLEAVNPTKVTVVIKKL